MIDFSEAKLAFKNYIDNFDKNDGGIKLKIAHTYGVVKCSEYISSRLNLNEEDIELSKVIALLHDIGRFEQVKMTHSFLDNNGFDHAEYGVKLLFEDGKIRDFLKDNKYDNIIYKAIKNHNKYKIEEGLQDDELLHAKIIRDADKMDNFRVKETEDFENMFDYNSKTINYELITQEVYDDFMNCKTILTTKRKTQIDFWVSYIAFIFDLSFDASLKYIKDKNYIDKLVDRIDYMNIDTKNKMEEIRKFAKVYLEKQT